MKEAFVSVAVKLVHFLWARGHCWNWHTRVVGFVTDPCLFFHTLKTTRCDGMLWLLRLMPSSCRLLLVKHEAPPTKYYFYLQDVIQHTHKPVAERHGGTPLNVAAPLDPPPTFVFVMPDLVPGEREQVPHQPHSRRLGLIRADPQSGPGDPLQR